MRTQIHIAIAAVLALHGAGCSSPSTPTASGADAPGGADLVASGSGAVRTGHVAALLGDGRVLVAGGTVGGTAVRSAQLFDPTTGQFTAAGNLGTARVHATATVLFDGRVLVVGGDDGAGTALSSAELFDPVAGTFAAAGALSTGPRTRHTATRLGNGRVVVVGGFDGSAALATVEEYTPAAGAAGAWAARGDLGTARSRHTATLLGNGRILVAGGEDTGGTPVAAELYDPSGGGSSAPTAGAMTPRTRHVAALLTSGDVLIAIGSDGASDLGTAEVYDAGAGTFSAAAGPVAARVDATASLLPDGRVVVAGGTSGGTAVDDTDVYAADAATVSSAGHLAAARGGHAATLLPSGRILLTGGGLGSAELLDRANDDWTQLTPTNYLPTHGHTATLLTSGANAGRLLLVGGIDPYNFYGRSWQIFNPAAPGTLPAPQNIANVRAFHTATVLFDGAVLVAGGSTGAASRDDAELFDGAAWSTIPGRMSVPRSSHTATLLPNGKVLLTGGLDGATHLASAETYDPAAHTFTPTMNAMSTARAHHVATLLRDGRVLVAGGDGAASADVYDPVTDSFSPAGNLTTVRARFTASPLADGAVLFAGGTNGAVELASADLYDGAFGATGGVDPAGRVDHAAALLPAGEPLVIGGQDAGGFMSSVERFEPASESFLQALVSPLVQARDTFTATQLPSGQILAWGGSGGGLGVYPEVYDAFSPPAPNPPNLSGPLASGVPGGYVNLTAAAGAYFTGGVSGDTRSADVNQPVFVVTREDGDGIAYARTASFTATTARVQLPSVPPGWWWLRAIVGGVPGRAVPFRMLDPFLMAPVDPDAPPRGSIAFSASGGSGSGYTWALTATGSHSAAEVPTQPTIDAAGVYVAGATPDSTDTVECTDGLGNTVFTDVHVGPGITIAPASPWAAPPRGAIAFSATGGCDPAVSFPSLSAACTGYTWSYLPGGNRSGGTLGGGGAYVAGPTGGVTDDIQVVDSLGNHAEASIDVTTPIVIDPTTATVTPLGAQAFTVSGGYATGGYTWTVSSNLSGGSVDAAGNYVAGRTGSVTDLVRVTDALGSYAEATVTVGPGVTIAPANPSSPPRGSLSFTASGGTDVFTGCPGGSCWSIVTNRSGGTIDAAGNYTAGATPNVTDVVQVSDDLGNFATTSVAIGPGVSVTPAEAGAYPNQTVTLTAHGGSGTGYTWVLTEVNSNGGSIAPGGDTAVYTAGTTRGVTDILVVTDDLGNQATVDLAVWPDWKPSGSGCSSGGDGGAMGLVLLAVWLTFRARPRRAARAAARIGAALILLLAATGARAQAPPVTQSFVVERFQPAGGAYDVLGVQSAQTAGHLQKTFRLYLNYGAKPLVLSAPGMDKVALLKSQLGADLTASVGIQDWAELSLALPYMLSQSREQDRFLPPELRQDVAKSGLGDLRLTPKARLVEWRKLRLGVSAPIGIPIGNKEAFLGHGGITFAPTALLEVDAVGPARLLFNLGAIVRPERKLVDLTVGNAFTFGAGVEYPFQLADSRLAGLATFTGESGMKSSAAARPMELLAGLRWSAPSGLQVSAGGGPGIGKGYGTPQVRAFLEIGWTTAGLDRLQEKEAKPEEQKPEEPAAEPVKEEPKTDEAKPEEPQAQEPEPPKEEPAAEEPKVEEPEPAAEDPAPRQELDASLRIDVHVYFDFNKKEIKEDQKPLLRRLAKRIVSEPRMRVVRIEGHADDLGPPDYNLWLSEERARSVKSFLERNGVPPSRIAVVGYGKTRPNKPGRSSDVRARNRRVEFSVQEY